MPAEEEMFWLQPPKQDEKSHQVDLHVWEKTTASSRMNHVRKISDEELPMHPLSDDTAASLAKHIRASKMVKVSRGGGPALEEETPDTTFLTTIATKPAVGLLDPLRKDEKDIRSYIQKKREMFLVQMALDVKKAEIEKLDEKAASKEFALTKSQAQLEEDTVRFEAHLQSRMQKRELGKKDAEINAKRTHERRQKIKHLKQQIATVQVEIGKFKDVREECQRYKKFLEDLTPEEWKTRQAEIKKARKAKRREDFISARMDIYMQKEHADIAREERELADDEEQKQKRVHRNRKKKQQQEEEERREKEKDRLKREARRQRRRDEEERAIANKYTEVSSEEEPELFFEQPMQLMDFFTELEEKNLFLIQESQDTEKRLDVMKSQNEKTKQEMEAKVNQLIEDITLLKKKKIEEEKQFEATKKNFDQTSTEKQDQELADLFKKVEIMFVACGFSTDNNPDTLAMLRDIESTLESLINGLEEVHQVDESLTMRLEKEREKLRRDRMRERKQQEKERKNDERLASSSQRAQAPIAKHEGKRVMFRSPPLRQERRVVKDTSEEEANARDHKVFGMYIDRKTELPITELPEEDSRAGNRHRPRIGFDEGKRHSASRSRDDSPTSDDR